MSKIEVNTVEPQCGTTLTLGASGDTVQLGSGASQTGFGRTGTVDWVTTPKVTGDSPVTAANGSGYFLNTSAGTITINLPAGSAGDIVSMADYAETWDTYNVTVSPNGTDKIGGANSSANLDTQGQSVTFVYVDGVQGWINTMDSTSNVRGITAITATGGDSCGTDGDYKWHEFLNPGTFQITAGTGVALRVSAVVVGGGGGGGASNGGGGGGGAGGYRETKVTSDPYTAAPIALTATCGIPVSITSYSVTVDGGGAAAPGSGGSPSCSGQPGTSGGDTTFHTLVSTGGGKGGGSNAQNPSASGAPGGSGGGGGKGGSPGCVMGGTGNDPATVPSQGNPGGDSTASPFPGPINCGAGGGGAGCQGEDLLWTNARGGNGGIGVTTVIKGSPAPISVAGGGGANSEVGGTGGTGGVHNTGTSPLPPAGPSSPRTPGFGGGNGMNGAAPQPFPCSAVGNGGANTGGGGGGSDAPGNVAGAGGSGRVIIRYKYQNLP